MAILLFGSEGEINTIMALSQEIMPTEHRSSTMLPEPNFIPLGGLVLFATLTTSFAGTTGFGLIAYVLGPIFFLSLTAIILLVASLAAFGTGFIGFYGEKIARKNMLLWGKCGRTDFHIDNIHNYRNMDKIHPVILVPCDSFKCLCSAGLSG